MKLFSTILKSALPVIFFLVSFNTCFSQILSYTSDSSGALNLVAANATGNPLTRVNGAGRPGTPCSSGYSSTNFATATTYSTALQAVETSVAPNSGYSLNVTGFSVDLRRSSTGPVYTRFAYSVDGGTTWIDQGINQSPNNASCGTTTTAIWSTTISPSGALKFRVYGFSASGSTGTMQILNLLINGAVVASSGCGVASGLSTTAVTTTTATLNWAAVSGAVSYNIQYRQVGTTTWSATTSGTNSVAISGLTPGTNYEFQVQTVCAGPTTSTYSTSGTFTTASASCSTPSGLSATAITATTAILNWTIVSGAVSYNIQYRPVGTTIWSTTTSGTNSVSISGLTPSTNYEFQVQTVCSSSISSFSSSATFITLTGSSSSSSGQIAVYFNNPVNTSVSTGVNAVYLHNAFADTIVAYINRAKYSIDIAQYDYNQSSGYANIATAINNAYTAGKKIRWIYDGSQPNTGIALLNSGIHTLASPTGGAYNIMHNKFVIIDAHSSNPDDAIVCTGSEDWGITQFNSDNNNLVFIQDSSLAHAYTNEFNMMWGDTGVAPNTTLSKFGPYKTDLGQHIFHIGGKLIELYFSPSDGTDAHIQSSINSANTDLYFGVYDFTMSGDANAIVTRHSAGVYTAGIVDQYSTSGSAYSILTSGLGASMKTYTSSSLVYHHKMVIVDPSNACSDPLVLTGSHNWTSAANTRNDENIIIIHNDTIANIYYQAFYAEYAALGGALTAIAPCTASTCGTPTGLLATSVTSATAVFNWTAVTGAISYAIQYRQVGTTTWSSTTSPVNSVTVSGLTPATTYEFQVETTCSGSSSSYSSSSDFTTLAVACSVPTGLSTITVTTTTATLSWVLVSGAVSYNIQYRVVGTTTWSNTTSLVNSVTISGLTPGTTYEFQVEVVCSTGTSGYSGSSDFTTTAITCPIPAGLSATSITTTSTILNWGAVTGAASYSIQYRPTGTSGWSYTTSATTSVTITGLTPATSYEFEVQTICSSTDSSGYASSVVFTTHTPTSVMPVTPLGDNGLVVYPNPVSQNAQITYDLKMTENVSIGIYNLIGQEIEQIVNKELQNTGTHSYNVTINLPGIYFVKLTAGGVSVTKKVVRL